MSRLSSMAGRRAAPRLAAAAAVAGFRPRLAAVAVAAAFSVQPQLAQAQPRGAQVIHGGATVTYSGSNAVIQTTNGAGTAHSAINWQSFSVPAGSITQFIQPSASSTSINRVIGDDPSSIYGTVWSNGHLVLVNPHGIAVGAGAVVDTNGFTASTLAMSEADAIAGRMAFQGAGGPLTVDGQVLARGGDVVLVGSSVQAGRDAVVRSDGAVILAAGEKVEVTGRGLEGIRMEVKAGNRAVNLGTLQGDAVGIFAGTLRHSGQIEAVSTRTTGGKVVLRAEGDVHVDGTVVATAGNAGGRIDVLGNRIALEGGALLRASGPAGGGQVRVGGDYQGASAGAPNAKRVYMDANARIEADATDRGNGGRVIVWSDEVTGMHGQVSARGGQNGGDGGFAEVSGKQSLGFTGRVDLRADRGRTGTLLLDPNDIIIEVTGPTDTASQGAVFSGGPSLSRIREADLEAALNTASVIVATNGGTGGSGNITIASGVDLAWSGTANLGLQADGGIDLQGSITAGPGAAVSMQALGGGVVQNAGTSRVKVGSLLVNAQNGSVDMQGMNEVDTLAAATAGPGNNFTFKNAKALRVGTVATPYGSARSGIRAHDGTNAGAVKVYTTAGALTIDDDIEGRSITLETHGSGADIDVDATLAARGGALVVDAKAGITGSGTFTSEGGTAGAIRLEARGGDAQFATVAANGAGGAQGGSIIVTAQRDVIFNRIEANGGAGAMGDGGRGGNVHVKFGRDLKPTGTLPPLVQAHGGNGANGDSMPGGNAGHGGDGGTVILERLGGDLVLDGVNVQVNGGAGGNTTVTTGAAGKGGNGGKLILQTPGRIVLQDAAFAGVGGNGGSSPSGPASQGAMGLLDTLGRPVDVRGLRLDGLWNNTGKVNVGSEASITGSGTLVNEGELTLASYSDVDVDGGVKNGGLLKVAGTSAGVHLMENTGTVHVAVGAELDAHNFASNQGVLEVHGVMNVDPGAILCDGVCSPVIGAFRNDGSGTIGGTGTLSVAGGSGTLDNHGKIAPGGVGSVGRFTLAGNLVMQSGSVLHADLANKLSHDVLVVSGMATAGGTVEVGHPAGSSIATGDTFAVLQAASLDSTSMPGTTGGQVTASASGSNLLLRAIAPVPAPVPAPAPATTSQQQAQQQVASQVVAFQQLFRQELEEQEGNIGKDDIVVTDTACMPR